MRALDIASRLGNFLSALLLIALVTTALFFLRRFLDTTIIALLYLIPLGTITAMWGFGLGMAAALVAFFAFNYFFIQPYYTLAVHRPTDVIILVIFLMVAVVIGRLMSRAQAGMAAATAREQEATRLYELSTALADRQNDRMIAQVLTQQVQEVAQGEHVELEIPGTRQLRLALPDEPPPARAPELVVPIETARGRLGEIRLWRQEPPLASGERRLLQTFASQGALALERAWLAQAEARARVLEESDRLKSAILSSVSHELRTPLSTIKAAASSLRSREVGWDSPASNELISAIDDEADHLNMLVGNLLDMSRIEAGALQPKREWNILAEIVESVLARMKRHSAEHHLEVDVPDTLPLVPVDFIQMQQVFTNLISNSLKYAPPETTVRITARESDGNLQVRVSNEGPQVPPEDLERIFDKFYRITSADRVTGTGLGLSICKGIIEAHAGRIWAENLSGGLAFNFSLPLVWDGAGPPMLPAEVEGE